MRIQMRIQIELQWPMEATWRTSQVSRMMSQHHQARRYKKPMVTSHRSLDRVTRFYLFSRPSLEASLHASQSAYERTSHQATCSATCLCVRKEVCARFERRRQSKYATNDH